MKSLGGVHINQHCQPSTTFKYGNKSSLWDLPNNRYHLPWFIALNLFYFVCGFLLNNFTAPTIRSAAWTFCISHTTLYTLFSFSNHPKKTIAQINKEQNQKIKTFVHYDKYNGSSKWKFIFINSICGWFLFFCCAIFKQDSVYLCEITDTFGGQLILFLFLPFPFHNMCVSIIIYVKSICRNTKETTTPASYQWPEILLLENKSIVCYEEFEIEIEMPRNRTHYWTRRNGYQNILLWNGNENSATKQKQ